MRTIDPRKVLHAVASRTPVAPAQSPPKRGARWRIPDRAILGILIASSAFLFILLTNTLPALRELRDREHMATTFEDTVDKLRVELDREHRYLRAVQNDPDVIRGLWIERNPGAEDNDPERLMSDTPLWWRSPAPEERPPQLQRGTSRPRHRVTPIPPRPTPRPRPAPTRPRVSSGDFEPPTFLLRND